ncbi:unnamed protein product [Urochloa humidicola]
MEPPAAKEAPPPPQPAAEEDAMLSATATMAKEAAVCFQARRYPDCADVLKHLIEMKEGDPKVHHNIAVTQSFLDGCPDPERLLQILGDVKKRSEELACASREQADSANGVGSNASSGSRGSGMVQHYSAAHNASTYGDEFDTTIITFNMAVILYHLRDYESALSVLDPLYRNIEPIDETTALHVCFLLLDITLALQDATKAADVIQYLERSFGVANTPSQNENASIAQQQLAQPKPPAKNNTPPDSDSNAYGGGCENLSTGSFPDESIEFESLYSSFHGHQNLGKPILNDFSRASDLAATAADLKVRLQIYKVRLLLLTRNLKVAKRELKVLMNMARGRDSSTELLLKSQLEYARGNYRKAVKLLSTPNNRTEPAMQAMFYNNLGCILHQQRSNHTSIWCFSKALKYSLSLRSEKPLKLSASSQDKSCLISYNCGIQHFMCGKPLLAAQCFRQAMPLFYKRPLFWLRFSECSLLALEKGLLCAVGASSCNDEIEVNVVGSGQWRQLIVNPVNSKSNSPSAGVTSDEHKKLVSLGFARQCLLNAQLLLDASEQENPVTASDTEDGNQGVVQGHKSSGPKNTVSTDSKTPSGPALANVNGEQKGTSLNATLQSSLALYDEICRKENLKIRQAVLGGLVFVELCLENPLKALSYAKLLQQLTDCSRMYVFLSHVYAAEALCALNRPKDAAEHLSVYIKDGNDIELPYNVENCEKALVEKDSDGEDTVAPAVTKLTSEESQHSESLKPEEARGVLYIDLGMTAAMQGEFEQADYLVSRGLAMLPNNPRAVLASVYMDLLQGKSQEAVEKLKQCRNVRFRPSSVAATS